MKKFIFYSLIVFLGNQNAICQSNALFPATKGTLMVSELFNKAGKSQGKTAIKILSSEKVGDTLKVLSELTFTDKSGHQYNRPLAPTKHFGETTSIDAFYLFDLFPQVFFQHPKKSFTGNGYLDYPTSLKVSQILKDSLVHLQSMSKNGRKQNSLFGVADRTVILKEMISVPIGNYEAFVVESNVIIVYVDEKGKGKTVVFNGSVHEWVVPGTGIVKRAIFNGKKGKNLMFYEELTSITNP